MTERKKGDYGTKKRGLWNEKKGIMERKKGDFFIYMYTMYSMC